MKWNNHSNLEGKHAFLSPSQPSWHNYDYEHLKDRWINERAKEHGTKIHSIAADLIKENIKLPKSSKTLNAYVNDAIGYRMDPEIKLYYSDICFGTADAIQFYEKKKLLRIHDLKTGITKPHMEQLMTYAALFCLEYHYKPSEIKIELRIYQNDEIQAYEPEPEEIIRIMDLIIDDDNHIDNFIKEGL